MFQLLQQINVAQSACQQTGISNRPRVALSEVGVILSFAVHVDLQNRLNKLY